MQDTEGALGPRECFLQVTIEVAADTRVLNGVQVENIPSCWKRFAIPLRVPWRDLYLAAALSATLMR